MSPFIIILTIIVIGVLLWLVNDYLPVDRKIKKILNVVVIIAVMLWLLSMFGVFGSMSNMHMGSMHMRW
jgi:hypothetical protein